MKPFAMGLKPAILSIRTLPILGKNYTTEYFIASVSVFFQKIFIFVIFLVKVHPIFEPKDKYLLATF